MKMFEYLFDERKEKLARKYIANFDEVGFLKARNELHCEILKDEIAKNPKKWDFLSDYGINTNDLESTAEAVGDYVINEMRIAETHPQYDPVSPAELGDNFDEFFTNLKDCFETLDTINQHFEPYHDGRIYDFVRRLFYEEITIQEVDEIDEYLKDFDDDTRTEVLDKCCDKLNEINNQLSNIINFIKENK